MLDKLEKRGCTTVGPTLAASLEHLGCRRNVARLGLLYRYCFGRCSSDLVELVPLTYSRERSTCYSDREHDFSVTIPRCLEDMNVKIFFAHRETLEICACRMLSSTL